MKRTVLWLSWGLNVALVVVAALLLTRPEPLAALPVIARPVVKPVVAVGHAAAEFLPTASPTEQRRWLIDELRAMGVSNHELARIVLTDLDAAWTKESAALALKCHGHPDAMAAFQIDVDRKRDDEMRAALGEEGFRQWDEDNMRREIDRGNVTLSAAETAASYGLWKDLQRRQVDLRAARLQGTMDESEVSAALQKATAEYAEQMKSLLGADRYAQSQRSDAAPTEASLRESVATANPTATQFQQLLQAEQQWNQQRAALAQMDPASPEYAQQRKALDDARDAAYRQALGDDAFASLQKEQSASYAAMKKHQDAWGLDDNTIDAVYGDLAYYQKTVTDYQSQAHALESQGQSVDWSTVNRNLKEFTAQMQQSLRASLGNERFAQLQRNGVFTPLQEPPTYARPNGDINPANPVSIH